MVKIQIGKSSLSHGAVKEIAAKVREYFGPLGRLCFLCDLYVSREDGELGYGGCGAFDPRLVSIVRRDGVYGAKDRLAFVDEALVDEIVAVLNAPDGEDERISLAIAEAVASAKEATRKGSATAVRYVLRERWGDLVVRQIKAGGKTLVATVDAAGEVTRHEAVPA